MKNSLPLIAVVGGLVLCILSFLWPWWFPPTARWTEEKNDQMTELGIEVTRLRFALIQAENNPRMHAGENPAELKSQLQGVLAEYEPLENEFENARDAPAATAKTLLWIGIASVLGGGLFVFANRSE